MMNISKLLMVCGLSVCLTGCNTSEDSLKKTEKVTKAKAVIAPTQGNTVSGIVVFTEVPGGIQIVADLDGLTPGKHGLHAHEKGDCSAPDGSSVGAHYNPTNKKHGGPDASERHVGDFGNIEADSNGHGHYERIDKVITLNGSTSIVGRAIVVHEKEDDFVSQPAGDSGAKIGCGRIEAVNKK